MLKIPMNKVSGRNNSRLPNYTARRGSEKIVDIDIENSRSASPWRRRTMIISGAFDPVMAPETRKAIVKANVVNTTKNTYERK